MRKILFLLLPLLCAAVQPSVGTCGPLLNEFMADPNADWDGDGAYSYRNDEWIEVFNPGPGSLSLTGYYLTDETGGPVYGFDGTLAAGQTRVVFGSESTVWESSHGFSATGLRLGNDGDTFMLMQVLAGDTLVVDAYTYNTYEAEDDRSSGRNPNGETQWRIFDALNPYGGTTPPLGTGFAPTPGGPNGQTPVPVNETTWGRVKALFTTS